MTYDKTSWKNTILYVCRSKLSDNIYIFKFQITVMSSLCDFLGNLYVNINMITGGFYPILLL